jgi:hypothetical protein
MHQRTIASAVPTKTCSNCRNAFPATSDNFRRDATKSDGWSTHCKRCARMIAKAINRQYYNNTVAVKGVLGWRCPLWTQRCGECRVINSCWRITNDQPEDLPVKLVGQATGSLRPSIVPHGQSFKNAIVAHQALQAKRSALRKEDGGEQ